MDKHNARNLVRAQVSKAVLYRIFNVVFAVLFAVVLAASLLTNPGDFYGAGWMLLIAAALGVGLVFLASRLFQKLPLPSKRAEVVTVCIMLLLLVLLQVFLGWQLRLSPEGDFGWAAVYNYARQNAAEGALPGAYFNHNTGQAGTYLLLSGFFSLFEMFGVTDYTIPSLVLNLIVIDIAVLLLYFCARRIFGVKKALFVLLGCFFVLPFILYVPVLSSCTLMMPFPLAMTLMWLKARANWRNGEVRPAAVRFCVLSAMGALGALLHVTVLLVWVAIALDLLILLCGKGRLRLLLGGLAIVAVFFVGGNWLVWLSPRLPAFSMEDRMPVAAWVSMGLGGEDGQTGAAYQKYAGLKDTATREQQAGEQLQEWFSQQGVLGVLQRAGGKLAFAFGDGSYEAAAALDQNTVQHGWLQEYVTSSGKGYAAVAYYSFAIQFGMLLWMMVAALKSLYRGNNSVTFMRIPLFGMALYLMVWPLGAMQLVGFLPLFILCAVEAAPAPVPAAQRAAQQHRAEAEPLSNLAEPPEAQPYEAAREIPAEILPVIGSQETPEEMTPPPQEAMMAEIPLAYDQPEASLSEQAVAENEHLEVPAPITEPVPLPEDAAIWPQQAPEAPVYPQAELPGEAAGETPVPFAQQQPQWPAPGAGEPMPMPAEDGGAQAGYEAQPQAPYTPQPGFVPQGGQAFAPVLDPE